MNTGMQPYKYTLYLSNTRSVTFDLWDALKLYSI